MIVVVGLVGKPLAGKETVSRILRDTLAGLAWPKLTVSTHTFRTVLEDALRTLSIEVNRPNLQKLATMLNAPPPEGFGADTVARAMRARLANDPAHVVIADGVRWPNDETMIRSMPEGRGVMLHISANQACRYKRVLARRREGEEVLSLQAFRQQDTTRPESFIADIGRRADFTIKNGDSVTVDELARQVRTFIDTNILPHLRPGQ